MDHLICAACHPWIQQFPFRNGALNAPAIRGFARAWRYKHAERVRRGDLRDIVEPSTLLPDLLSDNQCDHLNAGRHFVMFIPAMTCVSIPAMTFGCILLLQVGLAIMHPCTRYWAFAQTTVICGPDRQLARASARWFP
jgi:hypothetical protein